MTQRNYNKTEEILYSVGINVAGEDSEYRYWMTEEDFNTTALMIDHGDIHDVILVTHYNFNGGNGQFTRILRSSIVSITTPYLVSKS